LKTFIQISLAALAALSCHAAADETRPSLDALVAEALARNPEANVYRAEIAAAKGERRAAGEWQNPELTTDLGAKLVGDFNGNSMSAGRCGRSRHRKCLIILAERRCAKPSRIIKSRSPS
jgi:outer membrane protein TolC